MLLITILHTTYIYWLYGTVFSLWIELQPRAIYILEIDCQ